MKTLIVNNTASQGYLLQKEITGLDLLSDYNSVCFYPKNYFRVPKLKIIKPFYFLFKSLKYDRIIINCPTMWWVLTVMPFLLNKKIVFYYHGTDIRANNYLTKISKLFWSKVEVWYSNLDIQNNFQNKGEYIPSKFQRYSNKKKVLIFSRNDSFKKTYLYFPEIEKDKKTEYYFIDWFKGKNYERNFKKNMPENSHLISKIPKDLVYFVLKGFDEVKGQNNGFEGVAEKEIEEYRRCN